MSVMPTMLQGLAPRQMLNNFDIGLILFSLGCCVCMCNVHICVCVCVRTREWIYPCQICVEAKGQLQTLFLRHYPPCFISYLAWSSLDRLDWLSANLKDPPISQCLLNLEFKHTSLFLCRICGLNSSSHAHEASALPTEISPQHL